MFIFEFSGWCGFSSKKGLLKGKHSSAPVKTIRAGFFVVTIVERNTKRLLIEAMCGLSEDSEWLIKNRPEIDKAVRQARQDVFEKDEEGLREAVDSLNMRVNSLRDENTKLATENHQLRSAIKIVE